MNRSRGPWLIPLIYAWLAFVVSLAVWWIIFTTRTIRALEAYAPKTNLIQKQNMIVMEGAVLIVLLLFGGGALIHFATREKKRFEEVRLFFSSFSHDLKTSISRVVLQSESLDSGLGKAGSEKTKALHKNLLGLELQLENSLQYAQQGSRALVSEAVDLKSVIARLHTQWPDLKMNMQGKAILLGDAVAIESIFRNVVSNAVLHGEADEIEFKITTSNRQVTVVISDNGRAIEGELESLGLEPRPSQKGSGLGLFLVKSWADRLGGQVAFHRSSTQSLVVTLTLPGAA